MSFIIRAVSHIVLALLICLVFIPHLLADSDASTISRNQISLDRILKLHKKPYKPFSFVVLGDSRSNPDKFKKIAELSNSLKPDFVLHLGDIAIHGLSAEFDEVMPIFDMINAPLIAVIGNHDVSKGKNAKANFIEYFGQCDFTFDIQNIRFILEDNSLGYLKKSQ